MEIDLDPRQVKESFALIEPVSAEAAAYFYGRLFAENPQLRAMFPATMDRQRERLFGALARIAWSMDSPEALQGYLSRLGRDHRKFGVAPEHYAQFGRALVATIRRFAGEAWTDEAERAWTAAFDHVARTMIDAAAEDAEQAPPWWLAEVVGHELRTPGIAVLTVRPDKPFRYVAGQWMSVQSARSPREWRKFSIANAPRDDGLIEFHVRAVPGGQVSNALVRYTNLGDTLLLGPARGSLATDASSSRPVLCVADGTGIAPIKAIVEQLVAEQLAAQPAGQPAGQPPAGPVPAEPQETAGYAAVLAAVEHAAVGAAVAQGAVPCAALCQGTVSGTDGPEGTVPRASAPHGGPQGATHGGPHGAPHGAADEAAGQQPDSQHAAGAEAAAGHTPARRRDIHLFFGARHQADLYYLQDLRELESACPSLRVIPAVSAEPGFCGARGLLPDVVRRYGSWNGRDVYISGPADMVRDTTEALARIGTPMTRIRSEVTVTA